MPVPVGNYEQRTAFQDVSGRTTLAATDDLSATARSLVAAQNSYSIFVQKITVSVITDNAATLTFEDNNGTPRIIAKTKASPGLGPIVFDFGDEGVQLTEGKQFELKNSAAGLAAEIVWSAYKKLTAASITAANFAAGT